jgi:hypothetical protein
VEDGINDYPVNVDGRQTLTGQQFRVNSAGNIDADPRTGRLYLAFGQPGPAATMWPTGHRHQRLPDDLQRWPSLARSLRVSKARSDQWFPWVDVNPITGKGGAVP